VKCSAFSCLSLGGKKTKALYLIAFAFLPCLGRSWVKIHMVGLWGWGTPSASSTSQIQLNQCQGKSKRLMPDLLALHWPHFFYPKIFISFVLISGNRFLPTLFSSSDSSISPGFQNTKWNWRSRWEGREEMEVYEFFPCRKESMDIQKPTNDILLEHFLTHSIRFPACSHSFRCWCLSQSIHSLGRFVNV